MRRIIHYIILLLFPAAVFSQDTTTVLLDADLVLTTDVQKAAYSADVVKKNRLYEATIYYATGTVACRGSFKEKKLETRQGPFTFYYAGTERKMYSVSYDDNLPLGVWQSWHENGRLKDSGQLQDGKRIGYWKTWHFNGKPASEGSYLLSYSAMQAEWFNLPKAEKRLMQAAFLREQPDIRNGIWRNWHNNGQLKDSVFYLVGGEKDGIGKSWYSNGNLESAGVYFRGKEHGNWEWFHPNGKRSTVENYVNGKLNSMQCFDTTGAFASDFCSLNKPALFPGGPYAFEEYLKNNLNYPPEAKSLRGQVELEFTLNEAGKPADVTVISSPSIYFSREAERLIYSMPAWEPAVSHNRFTTFDVSVKLNFTPR